MKLTRNRGTLAFSTILLVGAFGLAGCSATPATDTSTDDEPGTDDTTVATEPWDECPGIVERFNADDNDPNVYAQVSATDFTVQDVGADVLAGACVISIETGVETLMWAILPGGDSLVDTVKSTLADAGFAPAPGQPNLVGNQSTGQGVVVAAFENGAALNAYLVYPTAFAPINEEIVYIGPFTLS